MNRGEAKDGYRGVDVNMTEYQKTWTNYVNELVRLKWHMDLTEQADFNKVLRKLHQQVDKADANRKAAEAKKIEAVQAKWDTAHVTVTD